MVGWTYDAAGNLLSDGSTTRSYDALNRVITQAGVTNVYNGDGVLVRSGTTNYTQDLASPLSQILSDGTTQYVYGMDRLYGVQGSARTWYLSDRLGSVRATVNDVGTVLATASYDPYGGIQGSALGSFGFTGELQQNANVYLRARWYDAGRGRFTTRDPFAGWGETPYSLHPYAYGYADPTRWTDPTGECARRGERPCLTWTEFAEEFSAYYISVPLEQIGRTYGSTPQQAGAWALDYERYQRNPTAYTSWKRGSIRSNAARFAE